MRIVDFGAGTGLLASHVAPLVAKVVAVDISPSMLLALADLDSEDGRAPWRLSRHWVGKNRQEQIFSPPWVILGGYSSSIPWPARNDVSQTPQDLQLKVWKDLAISKQILMRAATDALKLDPECTQEELKEALEAALKKVAKADSELVTARKEATDAITALEKKLAQSEHDRAIAQKAAAEAQAAQDGAVQQMANQRAAAATVLQQVKDRLAEREASLKAITTALADTPANVLKKLNALKKEKREEADARRQVESALNALRTEKRQQDQRLADARRNGETLVTRYRDLHALSLQLREQLQALAADAKSLPEIPELDTKLLEAVEQRTEST